MTSPKIAIVTPWNGHNEDWLRFCMQTVREQTLKVDHLVVLDEIPALFSQVRCLQLPARDFGSNIFGHEDVGNLARGLGAMLCAAEGYDAIGFLDADNWIDHDHVEQLWEGHTDTGSAVVAARRQMHALDGELLYQESDAHARSHVDTNCMFLTRAAFDLLSIWTQIPSDLAAVGDQLFWRVVRQWLREEPPYLSSPTVHYRTAYAVHYEGIGREPPPGAKRLEPVSATLDFHVKGFRVQL